MPKIQDLLSTDVAKGVAIGVGVAAAGALLLPAVRPMLRTVMKSGLIFLEKGRELAAEAGEALEDLVAEVKAEIAAERLADESLQETAEAARETVAARD